MNIKRQVLEKSSQQSCRMVGVFGMFSPSGKLWNSPIFSLRTKQKWEGKKIVGWQWLWRVISSQGKPRSQWVWPTAARLEPVRLGEDLPGEKEAEGGEKLSQRGQFFFASFISTAGSVAAAGPRVLLSAAAPDIWPPPLPSGPIAKTSYTVVPRDSKLAAALHILSKPEGSPAWDPLNSRGYGALLSLSNGANGERVSGPCVQQMLRQ